MPLVDVGCYRGAMQERPPTWRRWGPLVVCGVAMALVVLGTPRLRGLFLNTALLTAGVLAISLPLGAVLGLAVAKIAMPGRRALAWLLAGLLFVPLYCQAGAWRSVLGVGGWLSRPSADNVYADPWLEGWRGAIWVHAMAAVPWAALAIAAALAAVERRLEEQALLDAPGWRVLVRVSLRRAGGGFVAAAAWIAATCATEITVTDLFQIRTFAEEAYTEAALGALIGPPPGDAGSVVALGAMSTEPFVARDLALGVAALALVLGAAAWWSAPWLSAVAALPGASGWKWRPARPSVVALFVWGLIAAVAFVPLVGLAYKAGIRVDRMDGAYVQSWSPTKLLQLVVRSPWENRREWGWSLACGALAAALATALAVVVAWRVRERPRWAAPSAIALAIVAAIPAPLVGVWTIEMLNRPPNSPLAALTFLYDRTLAAPVFVQIVRALPLVALWLWSQLATISDDLLDAARSEGAGAWTRFWRIVLPLRRSALTAALAAALALAIGELSATLLVVPPGVTTISVQVFQLLHYGVDDRVAALCLSIFGLIAAGVLAASLFAGTRERSVSCPPTG
jgi:iron(III) transport system permease protein